MDVDLVIPMVFPQDPEWQRAYTTTMGGVGRSATTNVRYRSWQTEELLVQCCLKYMPWLRCIYLLLASESQVQEWMKNRATESLGTVATGFPAVRLVFHREFIPERYLPTFNVNTIEMWLHRIPDLSEHFIYSNDDFFPLSPLSLEDFFQRPTPEPALRRKWGLAPLCGAGDTFSVSSSTPVAREGRGEGCAEENSLPSRGDLEGSFLPCQRMVERPYPTGPNTFQKFVKNGLDMVAADWGVKFRGTWLRTGHSMQPMLRSTVEHICERHADRILQSFTTRRDPKNFNQYIFPFWQYLSGHYIDHVPPRKYVGPKTPTRDIAAILRDPDCGIICLNDNEKISDWDKRAAIVRSEIAAKLKDRAALVE